MSVESAIAEFPAGLAVGLGNALGAVPPTSGNIAGVDREACFPGGLVEEHGV